MKDELVFTELNPPEKTRTYVYRDGKSITFHDVRRLCIRPSGSHRLETGDGKKHVVMPGYDVVTLEMEAWTL